MPGLKKGAYKHTPERIEKIRIAKLGRNNPAWMGNDVGYKSLHAWISRHKERSDLCQFCGSKDRKLELALIGDKYTRELDDYLWVCRPCHRKIDGKVPPSFAGKKHNQATLNKLKSLNRPRDENGRYIRWNQRKKTL